MLRPQINLHSESGCLPVPVYWLILHPGQLAPPAPPPGVKIPRGILPPTLGSLPPGREAASGQLAPPPGGEDTLAWAACPPPQENPKELNAERFFF